MGRSPRQLWNALLQMRITIKKTITGRSPRQLWNALLLGLTGHELIFDKSQSPSIMECSPTHGYLYYCSLFLGRSPRQLWNALLL